MKSNLSEQEIREIVRETVHQVIGMPTPGNQETLTSEKETSSADPIMGTKSQLTVAIGADHGGVDLKAVLKQDLISLGYQVIDCGTHTKESVDYPDIARQVAELVSAGQAGLGVIIDGAGIGSCMAANKVPGVRAAMCYDFATAVNSREHNHANVITLGAGMLDVNLAQRILKTWLDTECGDGRHANRVDKITAIEREYAKGRK